MDPLPERKSEMASGPSLGDILMGAAFAVAVVAAALSINLQTPYLAFSVASAFVFHLRSRPRNWEVLAAVAIAGLLAAARLALRGAEPGAVVGLVAAMVGSGSFLVLGFRAVRAKDEDRRRILALLGPALGLVFFISSAQRALNLADLLYPKTRDIYLYAFDGSLGFQPSFLMGRLFKYSALVRLLGVLAYTTLPLVMTIVYAGNIDPKSAKPNWYILELFFAAGLLGWVLYNLVPGTGPAYAFNGMFPDQYLPYRVLHRLALEPVAVGTDFPRNAIPSLHMAWVLLLWWSCRKFSWPARAGALLYVMLTVMATLGTGEHYLVDLAAAVPFALAVEALCLRSVAFRRRLAPLLVGASLTLGWLGLVRFGVPLALQARAIPWLCIVMSTAAVLWIERRLHEAAIVKAPSQGADGAPEIKAATTAAGTT